MCAPPCSNVDISLISIDVTHVETEKSNALVMSRAGIVKSDNWTVFLPAVRRERCIPYREALNFLIHRLKLITLKLC